MADELVTFGATSAENNGAVTLNIPKRHFGEFIQGLLGEPRRIEKEYDFTIKLNSSWLANLDAVIMQRVTHQHTARLIDFQAKIYFQTGVRKTLPSREAFLSFADNSPAETIGVSLTWIFLIQFPHSTIPEKQAIRFKVFTHAQRSYRPRIYYTSKIDLEIEHTEVTWGEDIFRHIDGQIQRLRPESNFLIE